MNGEHSFWAPAVGAVIGAIVSGIVTSTIFLLSNRRKVLGYAVTINTSLITIKESPHKEQIEISYDRRRVLDLRSIEVVVTNIGTTDIEDQNVDFLFPDDDVIVMNTQMEFYPPVFHKSPSVNLLNPKHIRVHYPLLNPSDKTIFTALTANDKQGKIEVHARGPNLRVKEFDPRTYEIRVRRRVAGVIALLFGFGIPCILIFFDLFKLDSSFTKGLVLIGIFIALVSWLLIGLFAHEFFLDFRQSGRRDRQKAK
jgi:hypothetical protein